MSEHKIDYKKRAYETIQKRNLCSYMNETKWNELRNAMLEEMPFPPSYVVKTLFEDVCEQQSHFEKDVSYFGDWYEGLCFADYFHGGFAIEWMKVRPRYLKHRGELMEPEMIDASQQFEDILNRYNIPYEKENGMYCIIGYK